MKILGYIVVIKRTGQDGTPYPLTSTSCTIGRDMECDIRIQLADVSRSHCRIDVEQSGKAYLMNVSPNNPTFLNGNDLAVEEIRILNHHDIIAISERKFRWEYPEGSILAVSPKDRNNYKILTPKKKAPLGRLSVLNGFDCSGGKRKHLNDEEYDMHDAKRKKVSFGPYLNPEHFDEKLPPATPVSKGEKPDTSEILNSSNSLRKTTRLQANAAKVNGEENGAETPTKSLLRRRSPTPVRPYLARSLGLLTPRTLETIPSKSEDLQNGVTNKHSSPTQTSNGLGSTKMNGSPKSVTSNTSPKALTLADTPKNTKDTSPKKQILGSPSPPKSSKETSPEIPKGTSPKSSKGTTPKSSEDNSPKGSKVTTPESSPKSSKVITPKSSKENSPKTSKLTTPKNSKESSPKTLKSTPKSSKVTTPKSSKVTTPKSSKVTTPKSSKVTPPKSSNVTSPKSSKVTPSKSSKVTTPKSSKVTTPKSSKVTTTKSLKGSTPKNSKVTSPKSSKEKSPKSSKGTTPKSLRESPTKSLSGTTPKNSKDASSDSSTETTTPKTSKEFSVASPKSGSLQRPGLKIKLSPVNITSTVSKKSPKMDTPKSSKKNSHESFKETSAKTPKTLLSKCSELSILESPQVSPPSSPVKSTNSTVTKAPELQKPVDSTTPQTSHNPVVRKSTTPKSVTDTVTKSPDRLVSRLRPDLEIINSRNIIYQSLPLSEDESEPCLRMTRGSLGSCARKTRNSSPLKMLVSLPDKKAPHSPQKGISGIEGGDDYSTSSDDDYSTGSDDECEVYPRITRGIIEASKPRTRSKSPKLLTPNKIFPKSGSPTPLLISRLFVDMEDANSHTPKSTHKKSSKVDKRSEIIALNSVKLVSPDATHKTEPSSSSLNVSNSKVKTPQLKKTCKSAATPNSEGRSATQLTGSNTKSNDESSAEKIRGQKRKASLTPQPSKNKKLKTAPPAPKPAVRTGTPKSVRKTPGKGKSWTDVLKKGLMKRGIPLSKAQKANEVLKKARVARATRKVNSNSQNGWTVQSFATEVPKNFKFGTSTTGHVNSPAPIFIHKKTHRTPQVYKKGQKSEFISTVSRKVGDEDYDGVADLLCTPELKENDQARVDVGRSSSCKAKTPALRRISNVSSISNASTPRLMRSLRKAALQKSLCTSQISSPVTPPPVISRTRASPQTMSPANTNTTNFDFSSIQTPDVTEDRFISPLVTPDIPVTTPERLPASSSNELPEPSPNDLSLNVEATTFDFEAVNTPDVSQDIFISPVSTKSTRVSSERKTPKLYSSDAPRGKELFSTSSRLVETDYSCKTSSKKSVNMDDGSSESPSVVSIELDETASVNSMTQSSVVDFQEESGLNENELFEMKVSTQETPKTDYTNIDGVKEISTTPEAAVSECEPKNSHMERIRRVLRTPKQSPKGDYSDVTGVKKLLKTPKAVVKGEPDYSNVAGVKKLLRTPKAAFQEQEPDYSNVAGVKKLLRTPKAAVQEQEPDYSNVAGVKKLLRTPKAAVQERDPDYSNVAGIKKLLRTPKAAVQEREPDYSDVAGVQKLFKTPKAAVQEHEPDYSDVAGVKKLLRTPKVTVQEQEPDYSDIAGVKKLLRTPKAAVQERDPDYSNVAGLKKLLRTPKAAVQEREPDYSDVAGVKKLLGTPKVALQEQEPDYSDVAGVKKLLGTPKVAVQEPEPDYSDVAGVKKLLRTPKAAVQEQEPDYSDVAGVKKLLGTPKAAVQERDPDYSNVAGVKKLLRTPKAAVQEREPDYSDVAGIKKLLRTPKAAGSEYEPDYSQIEGISNLLCTPKEDQRTHVADNTDVTAMKKLPGSPITEREANYSHIVGIKKVLRTPKSKCESPKADYTDIVGLRNLMKTPREAVEVYQADYDNVTGIQKMLRSPRLLAKESEVKSDLTDIQGLQLLLRTPRHKPEDQEIEANYLNPEGLKRLMATPKVKRSTPLADYTNVAGVKHMLTTPHTPVNSPEADYTDVQGVRNLLRTPKVHRATVEVNLEGVSELMKTPFHTNVCLSSDVIQRPVTVSPSENIPPTENFSQIEDNSTPKRPHANASIKSQDNESPRKSGLRQNAAETELVSESPNLPVRSSRRVKREVNYNLDQLSAPKKSKKESKSSKESREAIPEMEVKEQITDSSAAQSVVCTEESTDISTEVQNIKTKRSTRQKKVQFDIPSSSQIESKTLPTKKRNSKIVLTPEVLSLPYSSVAEQTLQLNKEKIKSDEQKEETGSKVLDSSVEIDEILSKKADVPQRDAPSSKSRTMQTKTKNEKAAETQINRGRSSKRNANRDVDLNESEIPEVVGEPLKEFGRRRNNIKEQQFSETHNEELVNVLDEQRSTGPLAEDTVQDDKVAKEPLLTTKPSAKGRRGCNAEELVDVNTETSATDVELSLNSKALPYRSRRGKVVEKLSVDTELSSKSRSCKAVEAPTLESKASPVKGRRGRKNVELSLDSEPSPVKSRRGRKAAEEPSVDVELSVKGKRGHKAVEEPKVVVEPPVKGRRGRNAAKEPSLDVEPSSLKGKRGRKAMEELPLDVEHSSVKSKTGRKAAEEPMMDIEPSPVKKRRGHKAIEEVSLDVEPSPVKSRRGRKTVEEPLLNVEPSPVNKRRGRKTVEEPLLNVEPSPGKGRRGRKAAEKPLLDVEPSPAKSRRGKAVAQMLIHDEPSPAKVRSHKAVEVAASPAKGRRKKNSEEVAEDIQESEEKSTRARRGRETKIREDPVPAPPAKGKNTQKGNALSTTEKDSMDSTESSEREDQPPPRRSKRGAEKTGEEPAAKVTRQTRSRRK